MTALIRHKIADAQLRNRVAAELSRRLANDPDIGYFEIVSHDAGDDALVFDSGYSAGFLRERGALSLKDLDYIEVRGVERLREMPHFQAAWQAVTERTT